MFSFFPLSNPAEKVNTKVKLKTGYELENNVIQAILKCLNAIRTSDPAGFYFLLEKCRNPEYKLMPYTKQVLRAWDFLEDDLDTVPQEVKNVFLSATMGQEKEDSLDVKLTDPIFSPMESLRLCR